MQHFKNKSVYINLQRVKRDRTAGFEPEMRDFKTKRNMLRAHFLNAVGSVWNCKIFILFSIVSSVCITPEYHIIIPADARFKPKSNLVNVI